jgi:hypothetical protein
MNLVNAFGIAGGVVTVGGALVIVYRYWRGTLTKASKSDVDKLRGDVGPKLVELNAAVAKLVEDGAGAGVRLLAVEVELRAWRELLVRLLSGPERARLTLDDVPGVVTDQGRSRPGGSRRNPRRTP